MPSDIARNPDILKTEDDEVDSLLEELQQLSSR